MNDFDKRERYYFIRMMIYLLIATSIVVLAGCDGMRCGLRGKINPKTGEKYVGFTCNGEF